MASAESPALEVASGGNLHVSFMGQTLLEQDHLTLADFAQGRLETLASPSGWQKIEVLRNGSAEPIAYYRETAQRPGRVEITWYIKYPSIAYGSLKDVKVPSTFDYSINIPAHWLENAGYTVAVPGKGKIGSPWKEQTGRITAKDGQVVASRIQFIAITPPKGKPFTLLLNPAGPQSCLPYARMENQWTLTRQGDHFQLKAHFPTPTYGDRREFKIVVVEGLRQVSDTGTRFRYVNLRPNLELAFAARAPHKQYKLAGTQLWQPGQAYGWLNNQGLAIRQDRAPGVWKSHVRPRQPATRDFVIRANDGELNLINIAYGGERPIGPFNVYVNGKLKLKNLSSGANDFHAKTTYGWARDGKIQLTFEGKWSVSGIGLIPLLEKDQDFLFSRTWWVDQARFTQWEDQVEPTPPLADLTFASGPISREQRMAWTWNATLTKALEGSINGSRRAALETPEAAERRIAEIKSWGDGAVLINGLHFRFNFIGSKADAIARRNTRLAVKTAHRHGLKVLNHLDVTWMFYNGIPRMLELLDQDPDLLTRSVNDPLVVQASPCLNSPVFQKFAGDYLSEQVRQTGLDGYQLDEFTFERESVCGCDRCRALFHQQTGLTMPVANQGKWYQDRSNATWRAYLRWRGTILRTAVDQLTSRLRQVNPNLVWMQYTSNALSSPSNTLADLDHGIAFGCDYLGDEFHPNDILTNWRVAFGRFKSRQGNVSSYGNFPTWYLPKVAGGDESQFLYAWAIARMNRGNCWWRMDASGDFSHRMNTWQWQMDDRHARPLADTAVLLSYPTIVVSGDRKYFHEEYGAWLQTLATENIQYNVILDRDIDLGRLKSYQVLVLPNAAAISDQTLRAIEQFARDGGQVIASYETGWLDASGAPRQTPALMGAMNLKPGKMLEKGGDIRVAAPLKRGMRQSEFTTASPLIAHPLADPDRSQVWASILEGGQSIAPAIVATPYGKGRFIYIAGNLIRQNYEPRMATTAMSGSSNTLASQGARYMTDFNPDLNRMIANLVHTIGAGRFRTEAVKMPHGVIYTAFRRQSETRPAIVLHFLNVQGKPQLKLGQPILLQSPIPQPPLPFDVEMRLRADFPIRRAFLVAPLKSGQIDLTPEPQPDGACLLRIPKEAIVNYALVYVEP